MSFLNTIFLWSLVSLSIPILIALWNRKKFQKEAFGGYFLLKRVLETTKRRIRILEIIKLLNRLALFSLLVLLFANPFKIENRLKSAEDGFAILVDVGRAMQGSSSDGDILVNLAEAKVTALLKQMPEQAQGMLLFVSDRCDTGELFSERRLTARAAEWLSVLSLDRMPFTSQPTTTQGVAQCLQRVRSIFGEKEIYKVFISPLPSTLEAKFLEHSSLQMETLKSPVVQIEKIYQAQQELSGERVRIHLAPPQQRMARVIHAKGVEDLGPVVESVDLVPSDQTWLWIEAPDVRDPWVGQKIIPIQQSMAMKVTLWAERETPGYLSLLTALRNYPGMKVLRQVGGEPTGDAVIIYGRFKFDPSALSRAWFFVDFESPAPLSIRDKKQWVPGIELSDARRAFQIQTQDGRIFVKKYVIADLDRFETLETFEDGAPSLLKDKDAKGRHWISPFDLEDLTTDLSLEPVFIPYLYRRLENWLSVDRSQQEGNLQPIWLLPGRTKPTRSVLARQGWPGIYADAQSNEATKIVEPVGLPEKYFNLTSKTSTQDLHEEKIFLKDKILKFLIWSFLLELFLCLASVRLAWIGGLALYLALGSSVNAANVVRPIGIGIISGMDADRKLALSQSLLEMEKRSNLDFDKPEETSVEKFWQYAAIIISSTHSFGPFKKEDRERIRDYCERGGVLIFDDPLASSDSEFYRSVKKELAAIFPSRDLKAMPKDNVIFRTFYLLTEVSGRKLASPYMEGIELDKRWVAIFSFNDLLGANLKNARGDYALSVSPYGISQRVLAKRLWLNLMMYSVALDYKDDAIHLPHILKKRAR